MLVATFAERPDLAARLGELEDAFPEFMQHGDVTTRYWPTFASGRFPELQLVLYDEAAGTILGKGQTTPFRWDGSPADLPDGVDGVLRRAYEEGGEATTLSALVAVVAQSAQGRGLSRLI